MFGEGKPIIDPYEILRDRGKVLYGKVVVLALVPRLFMRLKNVLEDVKPVRLSRSLLKSYAGTYRGREVVAALLFPGSPLAVAALEVLVAMGGRIFVAVGYAGAVNPALRIGDVLVPTWGLREEGASFHYVPDASYVPRPDSELAEALYRHAVKLKGKKGVKVVKGGIWTTDAVYRETLDKVVEYSSKGVYGVDMESTALMTVANYRSIKLAIITAVSDELHHNGEWVEGFNTRKLKLTENLVVRASLNAITDPPKPVPTPSQL